jgi:glutamine amidotransferase
MHNGYINEFARLKRDLVLAVDESLYPHIEGSTDTEALFFVALTFGLMDDPPAAVARAIGLVEQLGERHAVPNPFQGTIATTDGERTWVFRYSSEGRSRSLFFTTDVRILRELYPGHERLEGLSDDSRLVVSEPLGSLPGVWNEVPESTYGVIAPGEDELRPFTVARP